MKVRSANIALARRATALVSLPYTTRSKFARCVQKGAKMVLEDEKTGRIFRGTIIDWRESIEPESYLFEIELQTTDTWEGTFKVKPKEKSK